MPSAADVDEVLRQADRSMTAKDFHARLGLPSGKPTAVNSILYSAGQAESVAWLESAALAPSVLVYVGDHSAGAHAHRHSGAALGRDAVGKAWSDELSPRTVERTRSTG